MVSSFPLPGFAIRVERYEAQRDTRVAQPAPLEGARQADRRAVSAKTQEASCLILHSSLEFKLEAMSGEGGNAKPCFKLLQRNKYSQLRKHVS